MQLIKNLFVASMGFLILIIFIKEFIFINFFINIETVIIIFMLATCLLLAEGVSLYLSILSLLIGHFLFFQYNMNFDLWYDAITKNLPLAILFVVAPVISIPLREGGYLKSFNYYISKNLEHTERLFSLLSGFVFSLGAITNMGSIRVTHSLLEDAKLPKKFLANVYTVGFAACIAWSPYFGSVNLVLYYTGVAFSDFIFFGMLYGLLLFIVGNLIFRWDVKLIKEGHYPYPPYLMNALYQ